ncbi:MAG: DUF1566 domain-containing protein, partial [Bacteroidales bacterium]|nr:DUF1566 domain-containing protein [Bacteroidales bacterium]
QQASDITANNAKVGYTDALVSANADVVANTAKNSYPTTDATKLAGIEAGAQVNVKPDWNAASGNAAEILNKPTIPAAANGSETKVTAGTNVTVTGSGTSASPYVVNATGGASTLTIGQSYQGGKIFWLDATGQHGLIVATADLGDIVWRNEYDRLTGSTGDGLYAGAMNTTFIVVIQMPTNNYAAKACADYSVTDGGVTYGDWYLPSKYELNLLYTQKTAVGGFDYSYYWSSTEYDIYQAFRQNFGNGEQSGGYKYSTNHVRAIRAF